MQLKQLKLAGFKSFVDPTVIPFSSQLIAVVGPNGCGKSNIIDAVRWVLGESSAKNLRGESMADVIFNGSSHRKPVGQASVELVFDNSMGRLVGQYATYQEISVKRLVTRDGDSFYFLNGSRCRRRDITDIFLGTGAGARSYSIIGQDTISRLIEARPDDLRAYLEEAAGISKYKERRRETLQRIGHTRENLARVADIREELGKQLQRLERQAQAAARYKALKQEERLCRAEILALKWRVLITEQEQVHRKINELSLRHEQCQTRIMGLIKDNSSLREMLHTTQDDFQQIQVEFYQLNTDIARLEETILQQKRETQRLTADKQQLDADVQTSKHQLQLDTDALGSCEQGLAILQEHVEQYQLELKDYQRVLDENERQKIAWDLQWQRAQTELNQVQREAQKEHIGLQHIEQNYQQMQLRAEKIQNEHELIDLDLLQTDLLKLQVQQVSLAKQRDVDVENHQDRIKKGAQLREQITIIEQQLHQVHDKTQALVTEQAALLAAQNVVLRHVKNGSSVLPQWDHLPRLTEVISVPDEWLRACELVLGESLQAIVLDSVDVCLPALVALQGRAALFVQPTLPEINPTHYPRLSDKIVGVLPCWLHALDQVFAADSLADAIAWLPTLSRQQSVVTIDGYWLGPGWVRVDGVMEHDESGLLARQQRLAKLNDALVVLQEKLSTLQVSRDQLHRDLVDSDRAQNLLQQTLVISEDALRDSVALVNNKQLAYQHAVVRVDALTEERAELQFALEALVTQKIHTEKKWQAATKATLQQEEQLKELMTAKACWDETLIASRQAVDKAKNALHQAELQYNRDMLNTQQLRDNILREQRHLDTLNERLSMLVHRFNELIVPDQTLNDQLNEKIMMHHQLDTELSERRQSVDDLQRQFNESERAGKQEEQEAHELLENIQQEQLQEQGLIVRSASIVEALTELDADVDALLLNLPVETTVQMREGALLSLDEKIKRLGAINLIAIDEYQTELERKKHLDDQYQDLMDALVTLDDAIAKMDKETQLRLKDTFDQVNQSFQSLFPRLFGGGRAFLELTCDNLLEAGVLVMAQPPGKRNSTIHLLSGGEKAMTAVALVFAIFQLNPSPFCMLDEVDAPLDESNVRRFCDLVKEMSQFVQFLFITHNKVTMELADHLIGVTMREPGVSRVVAVDVEEALAIAE
jgi:chromosome segregation protein